MVLRRRLDLKAFLGILVSLILIAGAGYGAHSWHKERVGCFIDTRVQGPVEYVNIKLSVMMTPEEQEIAYKLYQMEPELRDIAYKNYMMQKKEK